MVVNTPTTALRIVTAAQRAASAAKRLDYSRRSTGHRHNRQTHRRRRRAAVPPPIGVHPGSGALLYAPPVNLPPLAAHTETQTRLRGRDTAVVYVQPC